MATKSFIVRGRVQGVGFRWFVEREAAMLGLAGWVRNNDDGTVEVLASGSNEQLDSLLAKLKQGPRAARVDTVDERSANAPEGLKSFSIHGAW
jgi:acylphosphatase